MGNEPFEQHDDQPDQPSWITWLFLALFGIALYLCRSHASAISQTWGYLLVGGVLLVSTIVDAHYGVVALSYGYVKRRDDAGMFWLLVGLCSVGGACLLIYAGGALLGLWRF